MIAALALSFVVLSATLALTAALVWQFACLLGRIDRGSSDDSDESDSGGGGGVRNHPPRPPCGGGEPAWWPDFERDFAEYVAKRPVALR